MTAKEFLWQAWAIKQDMERKQNQIFELQAMAERATSAYEALRVGGTKDHSKLENAVVKLVDIGESLGRDMAGYSEAYREISAAIDAVENPLYRRLLSLRYLSFMPWEKIAEELHYDIDGKNVFKLHGRALSKVRVPEKRTLHYTSPV